VAEQLVDSVATSGSGEQAALRASLGEQLVRGALLREKFRQADKWATGSKSPFTTKM
jgi:hypothetical protein